MRSIRRDILLLLISACILSMMLSAAISVILSADAMTQELQAAELEVVALSKKMQEANEDTQQLAELIERFGNYRIDKAGNVDFSKRELARLQEDGYLQKGWQANVKTYYRYGDTLYVVYALHENIFTVRNTLQGYLNVGCTVFILFVIICAFGGRVISPIEEMTKAARRVGAGDFDTKVESHLRRKNSVYRQMNALVDSFNQMADDLKGIAYLRNDFARNLSHEVKTPIASISGYAQLMETTPLSQSEIQEYARLIRDECAHLTKLSENMLRISRIETRNQPPACAEYSLDEQIRRASAAMFPAFQKAGVQLKVNLKSVSIVSDRELLAQVWLNLLENALKFTPAGGSVSIGMEVGSDAVLISVADTGIGIAPEALRHIFDQFFQADASHRTEGNGLGLALCKRIVELLKGSILAESEEGHGSIFSVTLPLDFSKKNMQKSTKER